MEMHTMKEEMQKISKRIELPWRIPSSRRTSTNYTGKTHISIVTSDLYKDPREAVLVQNALSNYCCGSFTLNDQIMPVDVMSTGDLNHFFAEVTDVICTSVENAQHWSQPWHLTKYNKDPEFTEELMLHIRSCRLDFVLSTEPIMASGCVMAPLAALEVCCGNLIYCGVESSNAQEAGFVQTVCGLCSLVLSAEKPEQCLYGIYFTKHTHRSLQHAKLCKAWLGDDGHPKFSPDGEYPMKQVPNLVRFLLGLSQQFSANPTRNTFDDHDVDMNE